MAGKKYSVGDKVPEMELNDSSGNNIKLTQILTTDKVLIVSYRGYW